MTHFYNLIIFLFTSAVMLHAQNFSVSKLDGSPLNDGDVVSVTVATFPDAKIGFHTTNITDSNVLIFMEVFGMNNADGQNFETCYGGSCVPTVTMNQVIPVNGLSLTPGTNNGDNDYWFNSAAVSPTENYPLEYVFKFFEEDGSGNEVGEPIYITYSYNPELASVEDVQSPMDRIGVQLISNQIKETIQVEVSEETQMEIYSLEGKNVLSQTLHSGMNEINASHFKSGMFIVQFSNENGVAQQKILKL